MIRILLLLILSIFFIKCDVSIEEPTINSGVIDFDGNIYKCVELDKIWMAENLNVSHYKNGDTIPQIQDAKTWYEYKEGAWCYNLYDTISVIKKAKLYNWYAVNDPRGLAPEGFHIPSNEDWRQLKIYLGEGHGTILKSTNGWKEKGAGNNKTDFNALPVGLRFIDKPINYAGYSTGWWTSSENYERWALYNYLHYSFDHLETASTLKTNGLSVRCIKDYKMIENRYLRTLNTFLKRIFNYS